MPAIGRGQSSSTSNPLLQIFTPVGGVLYDVDSLEFTVSENITNPGTPVQVFPAVDGTRETISLDDAPTGNRLSVGHYVADYTPGNTDATGEYVIQFFFRLTPTSPEQTYSYTFEVVPVIGAAGRMYTTLAKVREEGAPSSITDAQLYTAIRAATDYVELTTGRRFSPETKSFRLDGDGGRLLILDEPIIAVSELRIDAGDDGDALDPEVYVVYNRHLSQNLRNPDDRNNPRIGFRGINGGIDEWRTFHYHTHSSWPKGRQNIVLSGVFGYTDWDGGPVGKTPDLICRVTAMLAMRYLPHTAATADLKWQQANGERIKSEKTADQSYELFSPSLLSGGTGRGGGPYTGVQEIDQILVAYRRPPMMAGV